MRLITNLHVRFLITFNNYQNRITLFDILDKRFHITIRWTAYRTEI